MISHLFNWTFEITTPSGATRFAACDELDGVLAELEAVHGSDALFRVRAVPPMKGNPSTAQSHQSPIVTRAAT